MCSSKKTSDGIKLGLWSQVNLPRVLLCVHLHAGVRGHQSTWRNHTMSCRCVFNHAHSTTPQSLVLPFLPTHTPTHEICVGLCGVCACSCTLHHGYLCAHLKHHGYLMSCKLHAWMQHAYGMHACLQAPLPRTCASCP